MFPLGSPLFYIERKVFFMIDILDFIFDMFKVYSTENDVLLWILVLALVIYAFKLLWSLIRSAKF